MTDQFDSRSDASVLPAMMLLVPGAIGVMGFFDLLLGADNTTSGTSFAVDICVKAMSLALGLYLSQLVSFPMKRLLVSGGSSVYNTQEPLGGILSL